MAQVLDDFWQKRNVMLKMVERAEDRGEEAALHQVMAVCERRIPQQKDASTSKAD